MSTFPSLRDLVRPHLPPLAAYTPGLQPSEPGWVKLNTNECPYPPSPAVVEALRREIAGGGASLRLYPNPTSAPLREALASHHGVSASQVFVGNGSDEIIALLIRACCDGARATGFTVPSYSLYPVLVGIQDGASTVVEFDRSMTLPIDRIAASQAALFLLTSPNAPTGVGFPTEELARLAGRYAGLLAIDEAYAPFAREDAISLLARFPRVVVLRTFSKAYALAGLRVGYALADPEVVGWLDRIRDSYNVNRLSQAAAIAAVGDEAYYRSIRERIVATRERCFRLWTKEWGWFAYPSQSNFVFVEPRTALGERGPAAARSAYEWLRSRKILVRHFPSHALTAPFLRVSVGTDDEMAVLNHSLQAWSKAAPAV